MRWTYPVTSPGTYIVRNTQAPPRRIFMDVVLYSLRCRCIRRDKTSVALDWWSIDQHRSFGDLATGCRVSRIANKWNSMTDWMKVYRGDLSLTTYFFSFFIRSFIKIYIIETNEDCEIIGGMTWWSVEPNTDCLMPTYGPSGSQTVVHVRHTTSGTREPLMWNTSNFSEPINFLNWQNLLLKKSNILCIQETMVLLKLDCTSGVGRLHVSTYWVSLMYWWPNGRNNLVCLIARDSITFRGWNFSDVQRSSPLCNRGTNHERCICWHSLFSNGWKNFLEQI